MSTTPSRCGQRAPAFAPEARRPRARGRCSRPRPFGGTGEWPGAGAVCSDSCGDVLVFPPPCALPMLLPAAVRLCSCGGEPALAPVGPGLCAAPRVRARGGPFFRGLGAGQCFPGYAHKDPDLRNMCRTQGLDPALVCGAVFPNSLPCVRHGAGLAGACCRAGAPGLRRRALPVLTATGADGRYRAPRAVGRCYADASCWHERALSAPTRVVMCQDIGDSFVSGHR